MTTQIKNASKTKNKSVRILLRKLGVPVYHSGYKYIRVAIKLYTGNKYQTMTKELHPNVARITGTGSAITVERNIRYSISIAWVTRDKEIWDQYFHPADKAPSNKVFISTIAEYI